VELEQAQAFSISLRTLLVQLCISDCPDTKGKLSLNKVERKGS